MATDLIGRPIVITGASSGIGAATALACARAGMPVALFARRTERLEQVAERIRALGGRSIVMSGSVELAGDQRKLIDATVSAFGSVYAVFANAGYGTEQATLEMTDAEVRQMFEVNFFASLELCRLATDAIRRPPAVWGGSGRRDDPRGHLLMCSSCLAKLSLPMYAAYCATKASQDHFCRAMRHELESEGIRVSSVHPIGTRTEFFEKLEERSGGLRLMDLSQQATMQTPEQVAGAIVRHLHRPGRRGGEVWTSLSTRLAFAAAVAAPSTADRVLSMIYRHRQARAARS